jgi:hypothetical protein
MEPGAEDAVPAHLIRWRRHSLVVAALSVCLGLFLLTRWLAERFGAPRLGLVAHMSPATASGAAAGLEASALRRLLTSPAS